jgi:hypothetical protein
MTRGRQAQSLIHTFLIHCCGLPKWLTTLNECGITPCHKSILGLAPATSCVCYFSFLSCRFW